MGKVGTIARRSFLIGSAAIAGGVAFGVYKYKTPYPNPLLDDVSAGEAAITPYVRIDASGITLITPRADSGQGAYSVQAVLIAEELDVELDQIKVDPGMPDKVYYNTAIGKDSAPFAATDDSFSAETMRSIMDSLMKFMGMQVTGGSTTVPDGFQKLRLAGAVARETLKKAAAQKARLLVTQLKTEKGRVILPDGSAMTYEELAPLAAKLDPVDHVILRDPGQWRLIGKKHQRVDTVAKATGTLPYGINFTREGMLHATVRTNPRRGGEMIRYDDSAAKSMRGVKKILPVKGGVAVVADNTWRAFQAADAIEIEWGAAPYPAEMAAHWQTLSDSFNDDHFDHRQQDEGDVEAALKGAKVFEAEYRAPYQAHAPLEPISAVVEYNEESIDIWTGTQIPRMIQNNVSKMTGIDFEKVRVHVLMMGGSFGHRLEDRVVQEAVEIARSMPGVPVKLTYSREEDMTHNDTRQIAMARGRGVVKEGRVESYDLGIAMPSVVESQMGRQGMSIPGPDTQITAGAWGQPLSIPDYRVTGYRAPPLAPVSSWRSVGASTNGFFHDVFLDELIHEAGADPMAERLRLCWHEPSRKVLEKVAEMSNWGAPLPAHKGRGVAFCLSFGVATAEVIEVTNTSDGIKLDNVWAAAEVGRVIDPDMFENMVQGGINFALSHAIMSEITYSDGMSEQNNFDSFESIRMYQAPRIHVAGLENGEHVRGMGEPMVPPAAAALSNAIFAATGQRIREMPMNKFIDFV